MRKRVLVIDDNVYSCREIKSCLQNDLIDVDYYISIEESLSNYMKQYFCLVIMDPNIQGISGIEVLNLIRSTKPVPVLILSQNVDEQILLTYFQAGASACLKKPVTHELLAAQAYALMNLYIDQGPIEKQYYTIAFGTKLVINPLYRQVLVNGEPLALTRKEYGILLCLASRPEQVFTPEQLYYHVWGRELDYGGENTVKAQIATLRKKLIAVGINNIQNSWGVGYRFVRFVNMSKRN